MSLLKPSIAKIIAKESLSIELSETQSQEVAHLYNDSFVISLPRLKAIIDEVLMDNKAQLGCAACNYTGKRVLLLTSFPPQYQYEECSCRKPIDNGFIVNFDNNGYLIERKNEKCTEAV